MTFGDKLKQARIDAGLKQSDLANIIGTTNTTISNWEKGVSKPDLDMLSYICGALNVKASFFLQATLPDDEISVTEFNIIKKYRALDPHGREMVDFTLQKEWERSEFTESANEVTKLKKAQQYYDRVIANAKNLTVDDFVAPFPDEDAPPKTLSELADYLINAAHAIENASEEDKRFDDDIMDDENF